MKNIPYYLLFVLMILAVGCSETSEDSQIPDTFENYDYLEEICKQTNTNIAALQSMVAALQNNDYVAGIAPVTKDGKTVGYTVTFAKSGFITIYYDKDNLNISAPIIGVMKDADGAYYWTLDGEWVLEDDQKLKVQDGKTGQNIITPRLKVEEDYWYISYGEDYVWAQLGKVESTEGNSFFKNVTINDKHVILTLADGVEITLPRIQQFDIEFDVENGVACMSGKTIVVGYTLIGADDETVVEIISENGWRAELVRDSATKGRILVTASGVDAQVIVFASTSIGQAVRKVLCFDSGVLSGIHEMYNVGSAASTLKVALMTNLEYTVSIPEDAQSWISVADTRAEIREETLTFTIGENPESDNSRSAIISLLSNNNEVLQRFEIMQNPKYGWMVRTLAGKVNEANVDDDRTDKTPLPFDDCGNFPKCENFTFDPVNSDHLWLSGDNGGGIRLLDLKKKEVTFFGQPQSEWGGSSNRVRKIGFTHDENHHMVVAVDHFTNNVPAIFLIKRNSPADSGVDAFKTNGVTNAVGLVAAYASNGVAIHPKTNSLFFNSFMSTEVYKFPNHEANPGLRGNKEGIYYWANQNVVAKMNDKTQCQCQFSFDASQYEMLPVIHPEGTYMYLIGINDSFIAKSAYKEASDTFSSATWFVGSSHTASIGGSYGYLNDIGINAKVNKPREGVFVKNNEYVKAGKNDVYDFYFTDCMNHCVRMVTPEGVVTTFAGRGRIGEGAAYGYADGWARSEAMFDQPCAIAYSEERKTFYIGDRGNKRIREIYYAEI